MYLFRFYNFDLCFLSLCSEYGDRRRILILKFHTKFGGILKKRLHDTKKNVGIIKISYYFI